MKYKKHKPWVVPAVYLFAISVFAVLEGGCSKPTRPDTITPKSFSVKGRHPYSISVTVVGGKDTHWLMTSEISSEAFKEALHTSIIESGVFQRVIKTEYADYLLDITILNIEVSRTDIILLVVDTTVNMTTKWELSKAGVYKVIWEDLISTSHKTTAIEAFSAGKRYEFSNQGAARENIKEGIRRLSLLDL